MFIAFLIEFVNSLVCFSNYVFNWMYLFQLVARVAYFTDYFCHFTADRIKIKMLAESYL
jgi:hypothetical protein